MCKVGSVNYIWEGRLILVFLICWTVYAVVGDRECVM